MNIYQHCFTIFETARICCDIKQTKQDYKKSEQDTVGFRRFISVSLIYFVPVYCVPFHPNGLMALLGKHWEVAQYQWLQASKVNHQMDILKCSLQSLRDNLVQGAHVCAPLNFLHYAVQSRAKFCSAVQSSAV